MGGFGRPVSPCRTLTASAGTRSGAEDVDAPPPGVPRSARVPRPGIVYGTLYAEYEPSETEVRTTVTADGDLLYGPGHALSSPSADTVSSDGDLQHGRVSYFGGTSGAPDLRVLPEPAVFGGSARVLGSLGAVPTVLHEALQDEVFDSVDGLCSFPAGVLAGLLLLLVVVRLFRAAVRPVVAIPRVGHMLHWSRGVVLSWTAPLVYAVVLLGWGFAFRIFSCLRCWSSVVETPVDAAILPRWRLICQLEVGWANLFVGWFGLLLGLGGVWRLSRLLRCGWLGCRGAAIHTMTTIFCVLCLGQGLVKLGLLCWFPAWSLTTPVAPMARSSVGSKVPVVIKTATDIEWSSVGDVRTGSSFSHRESSSVPLPKSRLCRALRCRRRHRPDSTVLTKTMWFHVCATILLSCPDLWPRVDISPGHQLGQPAWRHWQSSSWGSPWGFPFYDLEGLGEEIAFSSMDAPSIQVVPTLDLLDVAALGFTEAEMDGVVGMGESDPVRKRPVEPPGLGAAVAALVASGGVVGNRLSPSPPQP